MEPNGRLVEDRGKPEDHPSDPTVSSPLPGSTKLHAKVVSILDACKWRDITTLRTLAASEGGLVSDEVRRQACQCYHGSLLFETDLEQQGRSSWAITNAIARCSSWKSPPIPGEISPSIVMRTRCGWMLTGPLYTILMVRHGHYLVTYHMELIPSHRPILRRPRSTKRRAFRPDYRDFTKPTIFVLLPRLP